MSKVVYAQLLFPLLNIIVADGWCVGSTQNKLCDSCAKLFSSFILKTCKIYKKKIKKTQTISNVQISRLKFFLLEDDACMICT